MPRSTSGHKQTLRRRKAQARKVAEKRDRERKKARIERQHEREHPGPRKH